MKEETKKQALSPATEAALHSRNGPSIRGRTTPSARLVSEFEKLKGAWKKETAFLSSTTQMVLNPHYQRIIEKGRPMVPLLLQELSRKPDHWFWALTAITGADPVPESDRGNLPKMAEAWLRWGRKRGYCRD